MSSCAFQYTEPSSSQQASSVKIDLSGFAKEINNTDFNAFYKFEVLDTKLKKYIPFTVRIDVTNLNEKEKAIIKLLIPAADIMNELFWDESFGEKSALMEKISDPKLKMFTEINYGPWDRLNGNKSSVS